MLSSYLQAADVHESDMSIRLYRPIYRTY